MTGVFWILNSADKLQAFQAHLAAEWQKAHWLKVQISDGKNRTLDQNDMAFELYTRIGEQKYGGDTELARRECKLRFGVPILRAEDEKFCATYDRVIKPHDYETKLEIMEYLPVTRLMSLKQFKLYIDKIFDHYAQEGVDFGDLK